jgi:hypothetical protein
LKSRGERGGEEDEGRGSGGSVVRESGEGRIRQWTDGAGEGVADGVGGWRNDGQVVRWAGSVVG